jgi:hypothetical protein
MVPFMLSGHALSLGLLTCAETFCQLSALSLMNNTAQTGASKGNCLQLRKTTLGLAFPEASGQGQMTSAAASCSCVYFLRDELGSSNLRYFRQDLWIYGRKYL